MTTSEHTPPAAVSATNGTIYTVDASTCATNTTWHTFQFLPGDGPLNELIKNTDSRLCLSTNKTDVFGTSCDVTHASQLWFY